MKKYTPLIKPAPGYCLCTPYIPDGTFKALKETIGEDVFSTVLEVGDSIMDEGGNIRNAPCAKGDIIISTDSNKTLTYDFINYRFVHFGECHGVLNK